MGWAQLRDGGAVFQVRVAGVAASAGRELLHRKADEDFWSLPGGLFDHWPLDGSGGAWNAAHHEIGLYFEMGMPGRLLDADSFGGSELDGAPETFALELRWFRRRDVAALDVRPTALRDRLARELPSGVSSLVQRDGL